MYVAGTGVFVFVGVGVYVGNAVGVDVYRHAALQELYCGVFNNTDIPVVVLSINLYI